MSSPDDHTSPTSPAQTAAEAAFNAEMIRREHDEGEEADSNALEGGPDPFRLTWRPSLTVCSVPQPFSARWTSSSATCSSPCTVQSLALRTSASKSSQLWLRRLTTRRTRGVRLQSVPPARCVMLTACGILEAVKSTFTAFGDGLLKLVTPFFALPGFSRFVTMPSPDTNAAHIKSVDRFDFHALAAETFTKADVDLDELEGASRLLPFPRL